MRPRLRKEMRSRSTRRQCAATPPPTGQKKKQKSPPPAEKRTAWSSTHLSNATPGGCPSLTSQPSPSKVNSSCARPLAEARRAVHQQSGLHPQKLIGYAVEKRPLMGYHKNRLA